MTLDTFVCLASIVGALGFAAAASAAEAPAADIAAEVAALAKWKPLWDGKTFAGWHEIGKGSWKIADGAIHARHERTEGQFGHLVSDRTFKDFTVRLKYKAVKGNSGLYFRVEEKGAASRAFRPRSTPRKTPAACTRPTDGHGSSSRRPRRSRRGTSRTRGTR